MDFCSSPSVIQTKQCYTTKAGNSVDLNCAYLVEPDDLMASALISGLGPGLYHCVVFLVT